MLVDEEIRFVVDFLQSFSAQCWEDGSTDKTLPPAADPLVTKSNTSKRNISNMYSSLLSPESNDFPLMATSTAAIFFRVGKSKRQTRISHCCRRQVVSFEGSLGGGVLTRQHPLSLKKLDDRLLLSNEGGNSGSCDVSSNGLQLDVFDPVTDFHKRLSELLPLLLLV
jgi:hypothetical protein